MTHAEWTTALPDWESRIVKGQSLVPCGALFPDEAQEALEVFKALHVVDVPGQPTFGEVCDPWVFDLVAAIFGAYDRDAGERLIQEFFLCVSKKNGKSTLAAGIMLTALIRNWRNLNDLLILAPTKEAAENSFKPAAAMVRADPDLHAGEGGFLHIQDHLKQITHLTTKSVLKVVAADGKTVVGKKAGFVLVDELWEFGTVSQAEAMLMEATGGLISRPEGFVISITTQSDEPPAGVFKKKLDYARNVRDGKVDDPRFMPVIYEFPEAMVESEAYLDPENFYVTNPSMGKSVRKEWIEGKLKERLDDGDIGSRNIFLAKHLNIEIGQSMRNSAWAGARYWADAADKEMRTFEAFLERSEVVVVGADGGGLDDLFGVAFIGREKVTRDWLLWTHAWCQNDVLERRKDISPRLLDFQTNGDLTVCDLPTQDLMEFVEMVEMVRDAGLLPAENAIGLDQAGMPMLVDSLASAGFEPMKQVMAVQQGYRLNGAVLGMERKLKDGTLWHAGQPMMAWVVGNAKVEHRGNAVLITKQMAGRAKIDPFIAALNAAMLMSRNPVAGAVKSVFEVLAEQRAAEAAAR